LLDSAVRGLDLRQDQQKRELLNRMLPVVNLLPDDAARDQFAERVAFKAGISDEVVRTGFRQIAVKRRPALAPAELPSLGDVKNAEKALIWWIIQRPAEARLALDGLEEADLAGSAARPVFELARSLQHEAPEHLPSALIQRLSTMDAQLVTRIASEPAPPAKHVEECVRAMKRLRLDRERAAIQREIDQLQEQGAAGHGDEIETLWQKKKTLLHRIEELT
jgi:DNA primase